MITAIFSEVKVTEIYCLSDDFCKEFARHQENYMLKDSKKEKNHNNIIYIIPLG